MTKITLSEAIARCEAQDLAPDWPENQVIMAAAKAFACERCGGSGTYISLETHGVNYLDRDPCEHRRVVECPACTEFRKIAREGVEE